MNTNEDNQRPGKYAAKIEEAKLEAAARGLAEAAAEAERQAVRRQLAGKALAALNGIVLPELALVVEDLRRDGFLAEIGNGVPLEGGARRSLRLCGGGPVLVFTAEAGGFHPQLGWHEEGGTLPRLAVFQPVEQPTPEAVTAIIADFLTRAIC